jgi:hypothetical protein
MDERIYERNPDTGVIRSRLLPNTDSTIDGWSDTIENIITKIDSMSDKLDKILDAIDEMK